MKRYDKRDILVIVGLLALCLLFFWRFFTPNLMDQAMIPPGDFSHQFYAWRTMIFRSLREGQIPLWTRCLYAGYPLQADPQSAIFYPPAMLVNLGALIAGFDEFPFRLLEWETIAHVFLTSVFLYAFLRPQTKRRASAILGTIVFSYGGYLTSYPLQQMAIVESGAWLPLGLLGIWLRYEEDRPRALWLTAFALGMSILAGHPQTSMLVLYCLLAYQIYRIWRRGEPWYIGLRDIAFMLVIAAGLSTIQSLPSWQYMRLSTRADLSVAESGVGFPLMDITQFVLTGFVSLWHPLYIGILPLVLVVIVLAVRRRSDTWFWLGLALIGMILSFGYKLIGFEIGYLLLPGYDLFRRQERLAMLISLSLSVLATFGCDTLFGSLSRASRDRVRQIALWFGRSALVGLGLLFVISWLDRQSIDPSDSGDLPAHVSILAMMLAASWGLLTARLSDGRKRSRWEGLAIALVVLNLFSLNRSANQVAVVQAYPPRPAIEIMQEDPDLFRFQDDHRLTPQSACVHDLQQVWGNAPIRPANYEAFRDNASEALRWQLLNVKYVVTWRGDLVTEEGVQVPADLVHQEGEGKAVQYVYHLQDVGPRAWIVRGTYFARNEKELYKYLNDPTFDPTNAAVLEFPLVLPTIDSGYRDKVTITSHESMRIRLQANLEAEGLLITSELFYPGWQAYVNGESKPILEANGTLRAVVLPTGTSEIEFRYQPVVFYIGAALSAATWLLLLGVLIRAITQGPLDPQRRQGA